MIISYLTFALQHWRHLAFGMLLLGLSSFGQTFFISLFGGKLREAYHLSDAGLGTAYAVATFASALTLSRIGHWIDHAGVQRYTIGVALLLGAACFGMALSTALPFLILMFYLLRLGGQGLMVHTALTAIAWRFPADRGKALGLASLGMPLAEAVFPIAAVAAIAGFGWRSTWAGCAVLVISGTALALMLLPADARHARVPGGVHLQKQRPSGKIWRDPRLLLTLPAILAAPFITTGFFFHQARLASEKHWALSWVATCFVRYAAARALSMIVIGPVIDRFGAVRIMPFFLIPLGISMLSIAFVHPWWSVPLYLVPTGISAGVASTLLTALWVELYGPERLARARSTVESLNVIASGLSPSIMGFLIDWGAPLSAQAMACLGYIIGASWLSQRVTTYAAGAGILVPPPGTP